MPRSKAATVVPVKNSTAVQEWPPQDKKPSLLRTLQEGFAFGTGSSLARNFVDRVFPTNHTSYITCIEERVSLNKCILAHDSEVLCVDRQIALSDCMKNTKM